MNEQTLSHPWAMSKRHPAAIALDEWLKSPEGITAQCGKAEGQYLMNRIKRAFLAGYFARA